MIWRRTGGAEQPFARAVSAVVSAHADAMADAAEEADAVEEPRRGGAPLPPPSLSSQQPRRTATLRFVEMGEGMLTRFCNDLPCLSAERQAALGLKIERTHLLPRKPDKRGAAAEARAIEEASDRLKAAATAVRDDTLLLPRCLFRRKLMMTLKWRLIQLICGLIRIDPVGQGGNM